MTITINRSIDIGNRWSLELLQKRMSSTDHRFPVSIDKLPPF